MELQCNICIESPTVTLPKQPDNIDEVILCPSCGKQLSWVSRNFITKRLFWNPIDTEKDEKGYQAVIIIKH